MDRDPGDSYAENFTAPYPPCETTDNYVIIKGIRDDFKLMISKVSSSLRQVDVDRIRYLSLLTDQDTEMSALKLLEILEQKGVYSHTNIKPLEDLLRNAERCDLVSEYIEPYKRKLNIPDYTTVSSQTATPIQSSRTALSSKPKMIPQDTNSMPKPVYSAPVEESVTSKGDVGNMHVGTFGDNVASVTSRSELVLSKSSHAISSLATASSTPYGSSSFRNETQEIPDNNNSQCVQETETSLSYNDSTHSIPTSFRMDFSENISQLQSEVPQASLPKVPPLQDRNSDASNEQPKKAVPRELYNLDLLPAMSMESAKEPEQKSPTCSSSETSTIVNSSRSDSFSNKTATPTPSNEASVSVLVSGIPTGATATALTPDALTHQEEGNGFLQLKCYPSVFRLNRKQMGKKVLNHQQNSCFKHKLHIPIDKKRCGFTIRTETYPCGLGEDGKGDVRYISIKAIVIPFNIDHLLHFYKCTLKLIVQVSLVHPSSSSQEINQVSSEMILERGHKEFVLIVSKVLSHNQIIHGENKYFDFQVRAELPYEDLVEFVTKDVDDFVNIEAFPDLNI